MNGETGAPRKLGVRRAGDDPLSTVRVQRLEKGFPMHIDPDSSGRSVGNRRHIRLSRRATVRVLAAGALIAGVLPLVIDTAEAVHDAGGIELDAGTNGANIVDDSGPGDPRDWADVFDANGDPTGVQPTGTIDSGFVQDF